MLQIFDVVSTDCDQNLALNAEILSILYVFSEFCLGIIMYWRMIFFVYVVAVHYIGRVMFF